jgi:hypothetical protein
LGGELQKKAVGADFAEPLAFKGPWRAAPGKPVRCCVSNGRQKVGRSVVWGGMDNREVAGFVE